MNAAQEYKVGVYTALSYKLIGMRGEDAIVARRLRSHERRPHSGVDIIIQVIGKDGKTTKTLVRRKSEVTHNERVD